MPFEFSGRRIATSEQAKTNGKGKDFFHDNDFSK
jgi:hypothetical protein